MTTKMMTAKKKTDHSMTELYEDPAFKAEYGNLESERHDYMEATCAAISEKIKMATLADFIKTSYSSCCVDGHPIVRVHRNHCFVFHMDHPNSVLNANLFHVSDYSAIRDLDAKDPDGLVVSDIDGNPVVLFSGDENLFDFGEYLSSNVKYCTISFMCMYRMLLTDKQLQRKPIRNGQAFHFVADAFAQGKLQLSSWSSDERRPLSDKNKSDINSKKKPQPPEFGFTLLSSGGKRSWHRPAWICFRDNKKNFYIMGMDEDSYFCSMLPEIGSTTLSVKEALRLLVPTEADASTPRQGEWFVVAVNDKDVPAIEESVAFSQSGGTLSLPVESADSNEHVLEGVFRISKDNIIYAKGATLFHDEHQNLDISSKSWHKLVRNTARRSVSVQGVD